MWFAIVQLAFREIRHNLMRSGLTALGIIIGVAAVIMMVTLGGGATLSITSDIESMGRNLVIAVPSSEPRPGRPPSATKMFEMEDVTAIRRELASAQRAAPTLTRGVVAVYGNATHSTQVNGTEADFFAVRDWPVGLGRPFTGSELAGGRPVCILGETVREKLFGAQSPVGASIRVAQISCRVIGVLAAKGQSTFGQDQDDLIVMPLRTVQRRIAGKRDVGPIWISAPRPEDTHKLKADLTALMRERRGVRPGEEDDFFVRDMSEIVELAETTTGILTAFLSAIAAVSLVVGGIGIMNIMLVSVTERTREIGIRLAIGARGRDVLFQFLIEAAAISALGGIIGIALGLFGSWALAALIDIPFVLDPAIVALAFAFSALVGVVFGFLPARRAARLDPIEALRYE